MSALMQRLERLSSISLERYLEERGHATLDELSQEQAFHIVMEYLDECERLFNMRMDEIRDRVPQSNCLLEELE